MADKSIAYTLIARDDADAAIRRVIESGRGSSRGEYGTAPRRAVADLADELDDWTYRERQNTPLAPRTNKRPLLFTVIRPMRLLADTPEPDTFNHDPRFIGIRRLICTPIPASVHPHGQNTRAERTTPCQH